LADAEGGNSPLNYTWVADAEEFSNDSIATIIPGSDITYYVTVSDGLSMDWDSVNLVVQPSPQFTVGEDTTICVNHQLSLTIPDGYVSYEWSDGSTENQITVDSTMLDLGENMIWGRAEGENGCKTTDTIFIAMDLCEGLDEQLLSMVKVYPNPAKENIFLEGISGDIKLTVRDINGKEIFRENFRDSETDERYSINVSRWEAGTYFIIFESEGQKSVKKLLKIE
ncbi:MAG TPA: T9SS type A sorting domain-containing protein, partial [Bacteroidales bacterium]|nr:T9SS type A sorting domain-containing protein [Bacteroidales bacterium]